MQDSFWQARPVLVTGASGLMGGWLVKRLLEHGADVIALIRDHRPQSMLVKEQVLDKITVVNGSLDDVGLLRRTLSEYEVKTIFHLAAQPLVGVAKIDPVSTLQANIAGTWNILEAARQGKVPQTVVASSDKAYGDHPHLPYRETHALQGRYPYDVSKSCADLICGMYAATYNLPVAVLRCANLFGGGDLNFSRTIPGVIQSTLQGQRFRIRSDGKFVRDFLYVKDAAESYMIVAERLATHPQTAGEGFNFSLEVKATVLDIVHQVLSLMRRTDLEPIIENQASAEIREQYMSCEKAATVLGWKPRYSLEQGLLETIDWYSDYLGIKAVGASEASVLSQR